MNFRLINLYKFSSMSHIFTVDALSFLILNIYMKKKQSLRSR